MTQFERKSANGNMHTAKRAKNDEFYTRLPDIERELRHYRDHFRGKVVFCNCDDPRESNFFLYFALNFQFFGLKKLVTTHYDREEKTYKLEVTHDINHDGKIDMDDAIKTPLSGNGDFRSPECIALLEEADVVVTNPPFSLFREYLAQLVEYGKKFLIVGNQNAITYKEVFPLLRDDRMWLGFTSPKEFRRLDGSVKKFGNILWFTNLEHNKRAEKFYPWRRYEDAPKEYPRYENFDAIEVSRVQNIPEDYPGLMGVPITFMSKYNPEQFEIVGNSRDVGLLQEVDIRPLGRKFIDAYRACGGTGHISPAMRELGLMDPQPRAVYFRIIIRWRNL